LSVMFMNDKDCERQLTFQGLKLWRIQDLQTGGKVERRRREDRGALRPRG